MTTTSIETGTPEPVRSTRCSGAVFEAKKKMKIMLAYGKRLPYRVCVMSEGQ